MGTTSDSTDSRWAKVAKSLSNSLAPLLPRLPAPYNGRTTSYAALSLRVVKKATHINWLIVK